MEGIALNYIGAGLAALSLIGAAIGVGNVVSAYLQGVSRNPSAEGKLKSFVFVGAALAELPGLLAFVIAILLVLK